MKIGHKDAKSRIEKRPATPAPMQNSVVKFKLVFWEGECSLVDAAEPQQVIFTEDQTNDPVFRALCRAAEAGKIKGGWQLYRVEP